MNMLCAAHDAGDHDVPGEEAQDCPACEDRRQDEQAAALEAQEEGE